MSIGKSGRVGGGDYNNIIMENFFDQVEMKVTSIKEISKYFKKLLMKRKKRQFPTVSRENRGGGKKGGE